jgi:DNA-binding HxlR family transcriptional regulator
VEGVTARVLSAELTDMELTGFVSRKIDTGIPVIVEYQLTEYSDTLQEVLQALGTWGANHRERIKNDIRNSMQVPN